MSLIDKSTPSEIRIAFEADYIWGETTLAFKELLRQQLEVAVREVHLELASVKFMDSSAVGTLLQLVQTLTKYHRKVHIDHPSDEMRHILANLQLEPFLVIDEGG